MDMGIGLWSDCAFGRGAIFIGVSSIKVDVSHEIVSWAGSLARGVPSTLSVGWQKKNTIFQSFTIFNIFSRSTGLLLGVGCALKIYRAL